MDKYTPKEIVKSYQKSMLEKYDSNMTLPFYSNELKLFNCVKNGDLDALDDNLKLLYSVGPHAGHMSDDPFRQAQYMVVSGITLITRYALAGGLPESEAFLLSDAYLQKLSETLNEKEAIDIFILAIHDFTDRVNSSKTHGSFSYPVVRCIKYISNHLHNKITLNDLAEYCNVSPQYLSSIFHKELGITIVKYIRIEKLKIAAQMLEQSDFSINRISGILEFPSQSAFTSHFKELYGLTPTEYRTQKSQKRDGL